MPHNGLNAVTESDKKEPKKSTAQPGDGEGEEEHSPWFVAGVFGALGFEFVGFIIGGYVVGYAVDSKFGTEPWGVLVCVLLGLVGVLWHVYRVAKRFLD